MDALRSLFSRSAGSSGDEKNPKTVNIFLGFFFMVNFVLGTGFLGTPYAFYHTGIIAGVASLIVVSFVSWNCAIWELETMARAQALEDYHKLCKSSNGSAEQFTPGNSLEIPEFRVIATRKFEISELCEIFLSKWSKYVYLVLLTLLTFFACISYSTVAGSSWSEILPFDSHGLLECNTSDFHRIIPHTPDCRNAYRLCVFFFACIVVPLSLLELREQVWVQVILGLMRFFTIGCIIIYCLVKLITEFPFADCKDENGTNGTGDSDECVGEVFTSFEGKQWLFAIPVFVYASILHQGVPSLTHPVKQKKWLRAYFNCLYIIIVSLYTLLGVTVSLWFNSDISGTCTLNWDGTSHSGNPIPLRVLSYYIILFPSLDVCSVFPLVVLTMVNNMYMVIFGKDTSQDHSWRSFFIRLSMKLVAAVLPIIVALFISNLVQVLNYAGIIGFFICYLFPVLLQLRSQWVCKETFKHCLTRRTSTTYVNTVQQEKTPLLRTTSSAQSHWKTHLYMTPYSTIFSYYPVVIFLGMIGLVTFGVTIASVIWSSIEPTQ